MKEILDETHDERSGDDLTNGLSKFLNTWDTCKS